MARWLDDEEQRVWRAFLSATRRLSDVVSRQTDTPGLSGGYYIMLAMLSEAPGRSLRMSELAELVDASPSRVTHAVDRLTERGWVRREPSVTDRRGSVAVLTDDGLDVVRRSAPQHVASVRHNLFDLMTREELAVLRGVLDRVNERLDEATGRCRGPAEPPAAT